MRQRGSEFKARSDFSNSFLRRWAIRSSAFISRARLIHASWGCSITYRLLPPRCGKRWHAWLGTCRLRTKAYRQSVLIVMV